MVDYELLEDNDRIFKIKHPDGQVFDLAKSALTPDQTAQILQMRSPSLGEQPGLGDVEPYLKRNESVMDQDIPGFSQTAVPAPPSPPVTAAQAPQQQAIPPQAPQNPPPVQSQSPAQPQLQPQPVQAIPPDPLTQYSQDQARQVRALEEIKQQERAANVERKNEADIYAEKVHQLQLTEANSLAELNQENQSIQDWLAKNPQDSNRAWSNLSTANKVTASIAVLLSGLGTGLTGQRNLALDVINKTIDDDIRDQQQARHTKDTLYRANLDKYKDILTATERTRFQLYSVYQANIERLAAQSNSSSRQLEAEKLISEIKNNQLLLAKQITDRLIKTQLYGQGGVPGGLPLRDLPLELKENPETAEKMIVIGDQVFLAKSKKDAEKLKDIQTVIGPIQENIAKLNRLRGDFSQLLPGNEAEGIRSTLVQLLNEFKGMGSLTHEHAQQIAKQLSNPTSWLEFWRGKKNKELLNDLNHEFDEQLSTRLHGYPSNKELGFKAKE